MSCSKLLTWERVVGNVNEMVLRMQYSGYSKKFRYDVVEPVLRAYKTRNKADQEGERPLHRPKEWRKDEREQEKVRKKTTGTSGAGTRWSSLYQLR